MFGNNPIRKSDKGDGTHLDVQHIFQTIQGEGPFAGAPCVFVRLWGCNLRCHFCDTDFESNQVNMSTLELMHRIIAEAKGLPKLVVLTGGEPMRQNILELCRTLAGVGVTVQIETAGTVWVDGLEEIDDLWIVCSPKTGSVHKNIERWCRHWKYLVREGEIDSEDGLPNISTQIPGARQKLYTPPKRSLDTIWLQPCEEYGSIIKLESSISISKAKNLMNDQAMTSSVRDEARSKRNVELCVQLALKHNYRVSYQLHKVLGLP